MRHYTANISFLTLTQDDCTIPKCSELSEYIESSHTEVEDLSSRYINESDVYDRCGHDTRQLHPSCIACRISQDRFDRMKLDRNRNNLAKWKEYIG